MIESSNLSIALAFLLALVFSFIFLKNKKPQLKDQAVASIMALGGDAKESSTPSSSSGKAKPSRITPIFTIDEVESTDVLPAETNASALLGNNPNLSMDSKRFRRHAKQLR